MPATTTEMSFEQRVAMFRATASDGQARAEFAASRATVINPLLNEQSTVRFIFYPEKLAPGATPTFDIPFEDVEVCWVMPNIGGIPTVQVEGAELHVDTFGLDGGVEYQLDIAKDGRFQVAQLATQLLKNRFIRQEEMAGWSLIKNHASQLPGTAATDSVQRLVAYKDDGTKGTPKTDGTAGTGRMNIYTLNDLITLADCIGIGGRVVRDIYLSPRRFGDLRNQVTMEALPFSMRERLYGIGEDAKAADSEIRIHKVWNRNLVGDDRGYAFTQKDGFRYGVMPIREELNTRDNPIAILEWKIGIIGRERVGFGVLDDKGLIEIAF